MPSELLPTAIPTNNPTNNSFRDCMETSSLSASSRTTLNSLSLTELVNLYDCPKMRAIMFNETIKKNMLTITKNELDHRNTHKFLYHGTRSYTTNLLHFAESIIGKKYCIVDDSLKNMSAFEIYNVTGTTIPHNNNQHKNFVPDQKLAKITKCCVPSLFHDIKKFGENVFDFMDNSQQHGPYNMSQTNEFLPENKFTIQTMLNDMVQQKIIHESVVDGLIDGFEMFNKKNPNSHMLTAYGIPFDMLDKYCCYSTPKGGLRGKYTKFDNLLSHDGIHVKIINLNVNDPNIIVNCYSNI